MDHSLALVLGFWSSGLSSSQASFYFDSVSGTVVTLVRPIQAWTLGHGPLKGWTQAHLSGPSEPAASVSLLFNISRMESNIKTDVITLSGALLSSIWATQFTCLLLPESVAKYLQDKSGNLNGGRGLIQTSWPSPDYVFFFFTFQSHVFTIKISGRCMAIVGTLMDILLPYISLQTVHLSCVFFVFPSSHMSRALATKQISTLFYPTGVWEDWGYTKPLICKWTSRIHSPVLPSWN